MAFALTLSRTRSLFLRRSFKCSLVLRANNSNNIRTNFRNAKKLRTQTQYLASLTNFLFVRDFKTGKRSKLLTRKENLEFANNWVKKRLLSDSTIKSVPNDLKSNSVPMLYNLAQNDDVIRMLIERMFDEASGNLNFPNVTNLETLLVGLEECLTYAPEADVTIDPQSGQYVDNSVTTPIALLYGPLAMTESGEALAYYPAMNTWWNTYLDEWKGFLDSTESKYVLPGWLSEPAYSYLNLSEYEGQTVDDYCCWNDFFVRQLKFDENVRPIDGPDTNACITSACDAAVWHCEEGEDVTVDDTFWIKEQPYDLKTLLRNDPTLIDRYVGGTILQTVLFPDDYHRWMAPVSGKIADIQVVGNTYWTNVNYTLDSDSSDLQAWTGSVPYMSHLNVRMMIEIDTSLSPHGNIGKVMFIAVGLNEISSVINTVQIGDDITKGQTELGQFKYGGSTVIYLFEPNRIASWSIDKPDNIDNENWDPMTEENYQPVQVGQQLFTANVTTM